MSNVVEFKVPETGFTYNGKHYPITARTLTVCKNIQAVEMDMHKRKEPDYKIRLAHLRILIGAEATAELFPDEESMNLDFLETIYAAAFSEFTEHSRKVAEQVSGKAQRNEEVATSLQNITTLLKTLLEVNAATADVKHIHRQE